MKGPYGLKQGNIDKVKPEAGVYVLGGKSSDGTHWACYVGRSDDDIAARLQSWLDLIEGTRKPENDTDRCILRKNPSHYWRKHTSTAKEAYNEECRIYHDKGYSCNAIHPAGSSSTWRCPRCGE